MKNKEHLLTIVNILYAIWFIISFAGFVITRPLNILDEGFTQNISIVLTSVYNFSALAICGVLIAIFTKKKEKLIPALFALIAGLSNLFTGISLMLSGRFDYVAFNPLVVGICTTIASLYVIVKTLREK